MFNLQFNFEVDCSFYGHFVFFCIVNSFCCSFQNNLSYIFEREGSIEYIYVVVFYPSTTMKDSAISLQSVTNLLQKAVSDGKIAELSSTIVIERSTVVNLEGI